MSLAVIPLYDSNIDEIVGMLSKTEYDDSFIMFPGEWTEQNIRCTRTLPITVTGSSRDSIDEMITEISHDMSHYGYRRLFFVATRSRLFGDYGSEEVRSYIAEKLMSLGTDGLLYMDPTERGTYGYTAQVLTREELETRMKILSFY